MRICTSLLALSAVAMLSLLAVAAEPAATETADEQDDIQDVAYVGQPHPVLLRLHLKTEGRAIFARWDNFMGKLFAHLDRNKSGGLDRVEARRLPSPQQMQQVFAGNLFINPQGARSTTVVPFDQVDTDRDGKVTLDELKAYYRKNACGPVETMAAPGNSAIPTTGYYAANTQADPTSDPVFNILDTNKDGKLSREELLAAERVLMKYDANDDELVSRQELGIFGGRGNRLYTKAAQLASALQPGGPGTPAPPTVLMLVPKDEGKRQTGKLAMAREILARYDKNKDGKLSREEIGWPKELFDKIDRNKDGKLDTLELLRWIKGKPAGEFTIRLGGGPAMMMRPGRMPAAVKKETMSLTLGSVRIDVIPRKALRYGTDQYLLNLFGQVDFDKKGYITRKQVDPQAFYYLRALFDLADSNGDGRLTREELKTYLDLLKQASGLQMSMSLASTGQGLFQALDANGDGQLSVREMRNAWARLAEFDGDGDGCISRSEFPQQFRLTISDSPNGAYSGIAGRNPVGPGGGMQPAVARGADRGPLWFRKMDRNGDGDVSRSEWLGTKEDFDRIDTDKDGLISVEEAEAFDARMRKKD